MKRVKYETLGDLLAGRKAEQPSGQRAEAEIPLEQMSEAEAELAQIKERYATYRAAATAQAKLFAAQVELLKEQLATARNKALEEAAKVC